MKHLIAATLGGLLLAGPLSAVEFEKDILPIFEAKCKRCHMEGSSKGGVALDADRISRDIGAGKTIVPGDADASELMVRVTLPADDGDVMPPEGKGRPLSEREVTALKEWIAAGAPLTGEGDKMAEESADESEEAGMAERPDPIRGDWTNRDGQTIQATLLRVEGENAVLQMAGGKIYNYPIAKLSDESQAIVQKFAADSKAAGES